MKLPVKVTKEDIKYGTPGNADSCPVALAINRALRGTVTGYHWSTVGHGSIMLHDGVSMTLLSPAQVKRFVSVYDSTRRRYHSTLNERLLHWRVVRPFEFTLEV